MTRRLEDRMDESANRATYPWRGMDRRASAAHAGGMRMLVLAVMLASCASSNEPESSEDAGPSTYTPPKRPERGTVYPEPTPGQYPTRDAGHD